MRRGRHSGLGQLGKIDNLAVAATFNQKSCLFDGVDEYITLGNVHAFEKTDAHSWSLWIKTTNMTQDAIILAKMKSLTSPFRGYRLSMAEFQARSLSYRLRFDGGDNIDRTQDEDDANYIDIRDGVWHHIIITYDGSADATGINIRVDNVQQVLTGAGVLAGSTIVTNDPLRFASDAEPTRHFPGNIDEISAWNKELTVSERIELYNAGAPGDPMVTSMSANLVGWWRMGDEDTFPTLTDRSANSNNGTATNMEAADFVVDAP
jgi:hypothetical protein